MHKHRPPMHSFFKAYAVGGKNREQLFKCRRCGEIIFQRKETKRIYTITNHVFDFVIVFGVICSFTFLKTSYPIFIENELLLISIEFLLCIILKSAVLFFEWLLIHFEKYDKKDTETKKC